MAKISWLLELVEVLSRLFLTATGEIPSFPTVPRSLVVHPVLRGRSPGTWLFVLSMDLLQPP